MEIIKAKYLNEDKEDVIIFFDNNTNTVILSNEKYLHDEMYNNWVKEGGVVETYQTDIELLQKTKNNKIKAIDTQTAIDIESLVGDNNKQKDLLAESIYLSRLEKKDIATPEQIERLDLLESLNMQVLNLKYDGNNREAIVSNVEITTTLENALAEIEAV